MPEPLPIDPDDFTFRVATRLSAALARIAEHVEQPSIDQSRAEAIIRHASECDDYDLMAAWRAAAGIAAVVKLTPAQIRELATLFGTSDTPTSQ